MNASLRFAAVFLLAAIPLMVFGCGSDDGDEPFRECVVDSDCGEGFRCEYQQCKRIPFEDGDLAEEPQDGDLDLSEEDLDDEAEAEIDLIDDEEESEPDQESSEPDVDTVEGENEEDLPTCDGETLDPACDFLAESYCRENTVDHSVMVCHDNGELYFCIQKYDPCYPVCGYFTSERYQKTCLEGCTANSDPELDDYCAEDGPPDGDEDDDIEGEEDVEPEEDEEWDYDRPNRNDGFPCSTDEDCLNGHSCQLDWDDEGRYCARDRFTCVYHVGLEQDELAHFHTAGDIVCGGNSYRRCTSAGSWSAPIECAAQECVSQYLLWPGQSCEDNVGCTPWPRPDPYPCPDNYACFDEHNCRGDCVTHDHCSPGLICLEGDCVPNQK